MTTPILIDFPDTIETERMIIRPPQLAEVQTLYEAVIDSQAELDPWMPWSKGYTLEETTRFVRRAMAHFIMREDFALTLWRKDDQAYIGGCGLHRIEWAQRKFEIGYWLRTRMTGHGYMTEAVHALTRLCFDTLDATRVEIRCDAANERSASVARRAGYTQEAHLRQSEVNTAGDLADTLIFGMIRTDYDARFNTNRV